MKYKNGTITNRPNVPVSNPSDETLLEYGWKTYVNNIPEYNPETHRLEKGEIEETDTEAVQKWNAVELTELEMLQRHVISNQDIRIAKLERKLERLAESGTTESLKEEEPEIPYDNGILVKAGQIIVEAGKRYMVVQPQFTTQENWRPSLGIPALWREVPELQSGYPDWIQPTGAHDAYQIGNIVMYKGQAWVSKINANTTVPDGDVPHNRYWEPYE